MDAPREDSDARQGPDAAVVETLVENHRAFLEFLARRVGGRERAEDLLQDAFVRALEKASSLRQDESAVAWFYRLLRNALVDEHRRRGAAERLLAGYAERAARESPEPELEAEICRCVASLAGTLKPEYAEALRSVDLEGRPVGEFAAQAGISANNASVRLHRARQALRRRVLSACGTCAEHGCLDCSCGAPGGRAGGV